MSEVLCVEVKSREVMNPVPHACSCARRAEMEVVSWVAEAAVLVPEMPCWFALLVQALTSLQLLIVSWILMME